MNIVGLDLSLTATGICTADKCETITVKTKDILRLHDLRRLIGRKLEKPALVVLEGYSFGSKNSQAHALGELGGVIRYHLWYWGFPYVNVPPTVLKKFATGKGNCGKDAMVAAAARLGCPADDNNAVDAWWLRQMGRYAYWKSGDQRLVKTAYRDEAISKVEWPKP